MAIDGLSPVANSASIFTPVSDWVGRLVAPLGSALLSKNGMMELAGRVNWIVALVIAAVIVAIKYGYLTGRAAPTDSSSTKPARSPDLPVLPGPEENSRPVEVELPNPEDLTENPVENLPMMPGVIADDARPADAALFDVLEQRVEQQGQDLERIGQDLERIGQDVERIRLDLEQVRRDAEQVEQGLEQDRQRMEQDIERIRLDLGQDRQRIDRLRQQFYQEMNQMVEQFLAERRRVITKPGQLFR